MTTDESHSSTRTYKAQGLWNGSEKVRKKEDENGKNEN